jgi:hypothetical protein
VTNKNIRIEASKKTQRAHGELIAELATESLGKCTVIRITESAGTCGVWLGTDLAGAGADAHEALHDALRTTRTWGRTQ